MENGDVKAEKKSDDKHIQTQNIIQKLVQNSMHPALEKSTISERASDRVTSFIGSWVFITIFFTYIFIWISLDAFALINHWDPYPFILLNLTLSVLAAVQAPIILMAQNRQAKKDRIRMEYDYAVDRKAEKEIEKIQEQLNRIESKLEKR